MSKANRADQTIHLTWQQQQHSHGPTTITSANAQSHHHRHHHHQSRCDAPMYLALAPNSEEVRGFFFVAQITTSFSVGGGTNIHTHTHSHAQCVHASPSEYTIIIIVIRLYCCAGFEWGEYVGALFALIAAHKHNTERSARHIRPHIYRDGYFFG